MTSLAVVTQGKVKKSDHIPIGQESRVDQRMRERAAIRGTIYREGLARSYLAESKQQPNIDVLENMRNSNDLDVHCTENANNDTHGANDTDR